jgi:hypothetical protein
MNIRQNMNGYYVISDVINSYLVTRKYAGYTKIESIKRFLRDTQ